MRNSCYIGGYMNLFIDTNIFLSFFHFTNDDLEEIHKLTVLVEKKKVVLWVTEQVKNEFYRNRGNKLGDALNRLKDVKVKPQFPQICKGYDEYNEVRDLHEKYLKKLYL